jgi:hypothetical protein
MEKKYVYPHSCTKDLGFTEKDSLREFVSVRKTPVVSAPRTVALGGWLLPRDLAVSSGSVTKTPCRDPS